MKKLVLIGVELVLTIGLALAQTGPVVGVKDLCVPTVVGRDCNILTVLTIEGTEGLDLEEVEVEFEGLPKGAVNQVRLMYSGTASPLLGQTLSQGIRMHNSYFGASQTLFADPSYAITLGSARPGKDGAAQIRVEPGKTLAAGRNWLYISASFNKKKVRDMAAVYRMRVCGVRINGAQARIVSEATASPERRFAIGLRNHGDDGAFAYRIPGIVTTPEGTLIAVYDVRWHTALDLQEDIDVGMSRSTDGGRTWEKMRIIMDMGQWGRLPQSQNGIGDPAVLADEKTGEIFVVAAWTHGIGGDRAWDRVGDGFSPHETAQLMIVSSKDDGKTWSAPRNITQQVKQRSWRFTLQGPGRGICMKDGTLVFPIQFIDSLKVPHAGIMYSQDRGETWNCHGAAWDNVTESQVAEVEPGVLMLNMRNNLRGGRIVCTSTDLGRTWTEHPSSETLREPVCMASLLQVPASENVLGRDILLFSNPDTSSGRNRITIKASLDGGLTWPAEHQLLLDEGYGWGYSCLTMIDEATVGILYEGSVSQILFQAVRLEDIL